MAIAGQLEIQLLADVARIKQDMDKATGHITSGAKAMERAAAGVKAALGGIVAGMSVAAMSNWIKGAIDAADNMSKLSQKIGVATKDIAGLQLAYRLAGAGSDSMVTSLGRLSKGVVEGNDGLKALGIRTKDAGGEFKATNAVLSEVADRFKSMPDGVQKTALAIEIFGKAGAEMIPLLNGGSEGLRQMDEMARKLGLTVSNETGKRAEEFNDTLDLIGQGSQGVARQLMAELLPTLQNLAGSFLTSMTEGDKLSKAAGFLGTALKGLYSIGVGVVELFSTVGKVLGGVGGGIGMILRGEFVLGANVIKETLSDIGAGWKDTANTIKAAWADEGNAAVAAAAKAMGAQGDLLAAAKARADAAKAAAAAAKKEAEEYERLIARLNGKDSGVSPEFLKNLNMIVEGGRKRGQTQAEINRLIEIEISLQPYMIAQAKEAADTAQAHVDWKRKQILAEHDAAAAQVKGAEDALKAAKDELANRGKLKSQIELTTIARKEEQLAAMEAGTVAYAALEDEIRIRKELVGTLQSTEMADANEKAAKAAEEQWKQVSDAFVDNLMRGGKSVAQYLKDLFRTLVLRPILQPIGNMMGSLANGVMGSGATGAVQGGMGSLLGNGLGAMFGAGGLGGSLMAGAGWMTGAATLGGTLSAATSLMGTAGGMLSGLGMLAGALGPLAIAGVALASLFGSKGGPKEESAFNYNYAGTTTPIASVAGMPQGGMAQQISDTIESTYAGIAKQLGIKDGALQVGVIVAQDPKGTAQTILGVETSAGYSRSNRLGGIENVGRSDEELKAAIAEETVRAIFEALKASNLSDQYKSWLNSVTGGAAEMQAAIDRVTKASTEKQNLEALLFDMTATDLEKLNKIRDAERASVDESNRALLEQVYAMQDLKSATESTTKALVDQSDLARNIAGSYVEYMRLMGRINAGIPIRGYADGGTASGLAMVGERGPELVDFSQPGQVYTAEQTRGMFSGGSGLAPLLAEVRDELRAIRTEDKARGDVIKGASLKTAEVLTYIKTNGMPLGEDLLAGS